MKNVAIFASGEGTNAENLIRHFANDPRIRIKLVVTNNENAGVVKKAEHYRKNIQIVSKEALEKYSEQLVEFLKVEKIDLIVLAGFLLKVPGAMISAFRGKIINIHPSLLPKYGGKGMYGMRVHKAVIENKDTESGVTIHLVDEEYDRGDIILQARCKVDENETPDSLSQKIRQLEFKYLPVAVEKFL
jgi:phosphoribosylglycinamide formyltransferase 1